MQTPQHYYPKKHHAKPYRKRHLALLFVALFLIAWTSYQIGRIDVPSQATTPSSANRLSDEVLKPLDVRSSLGFSLQINSSIFSVETEKRQEATGESGSANREPITQVLTRALPGILPSAQSASQMTFVVTGDDDFAPSSDEFMQVSLISSEDTIVGTSQSPAVKRIYKLQPTHGDDTLPAVYAITWTVKLPSGEQLGILAQGMGETSELPVVYHELLNSLHIGDDTATLGSQITVAQSSQSWLPALRKDNRIDPKFLTDLVSPAIVKLYHVACASIQLDNQPIDQNRCRAATGSGFLFSSDGHIATNGHVVVYEPEDVLVELLLANPSDLTSFLQNKLALTSSQVDSLRGRPDALAAVIARIYELPEGQVAFTSKKEVILAAIGNEPVMPETEAELEALFDARDTKKVKLATLIAHDYSGKDQLNLLSGSEEGFTSSDVAVLKINVENAPLLRFAQSSQITQGQTISLVGFPGDAENGLVDTSRLNVSTSSGTINSIRRAVGSRGILFQTDADASQGSSGGPAINDQGQVFGLLTYRFKDDTPQNAAKSYVRDIQDIRNLLESKAILPNVNSRTQDAWEQALAFYSEGYFSQSLPLFKEVVELYPPHRLVGSYLQQTEQNIADGLDRTKPPAALFVGLFGGIGGIFGSTVIIARQHRHHHAFRSHQRGLISSRENIEPVFDTQE